MPISLDPSQATEWEITITHLKIGVYQAAIFDKSGAMLQEWRMQRTDDSKPDRFAISSDANISGGSFWFQAVVIDPSGLGGPYECRIDLLQAGKIVGSENYSGDVPSGAGRFGATSASIPFT